MATSSQCGRPSEPFRLATNRHGNPVILCRWKEGRVYRRRHFPVGEGISPALTIEALKLATGVGDLGWQDSSRPWDIKPYYAKAMGAGLPVDELPVVKRPRRHGGSRVTLAEFADEYREFVRCENSESTMSDAIESTLKALELFIGDHELEGFRGMRGLPAKLSEFLPNKYSPERRGNVAPETILNRISRLRDLLRVAWIEGAIDERPRLLDEPMPRSLKEESNRRKREKRPLSPEEMSKLIQVLEDPQGQAETIAFGLTLMCLYTGLRYGEVSALRWTESFDPKRKGRIKIYWSWSKKSRKLLPTKNREKWIIVSTPRIDRVLMSVRPLTRMGRNFVFSVTDGETPLEYKRWLGAFKSAMVRAEVECRHGLAQKLFRKSFITAGGVCGVPLKFLSAQYGHTTTETIQKEYDLHVDPDEWPSEEERAYYESVYCFSQLMEGRRA